MKAKPVESRDQPLSGLLAEWREDAPLPPRFQERVWQSISRAPAPGPRTLWTSFQAWLGPRLARPAFAAPYVAALLMLGVSAGWLQSRHESSRVRTELGDRYLRSLDPYQAPRH